MKRLLWVPTATTLAGSVALSFPIIYKKREKPYLHFKSDS